MKLLEERWTDYLLTEVPPSIHERTALELRKAYYAGARDAADMLAGAAEESADRFIAVLGLLVIEIADFQSKHAQKRETT